MRGDECVASTFPAEPCAPVLRFSRAAPSLGLARQAQIPSYQFESLTASLPLSRTAPLGQRFWPVPPAPLLLH